MARLRSQIGARLQTMTSSHLPMDHVVRMKAAAAKDAAVRKAGSCPTPLNESRAVMRRRNLQRRRSGRSRWALVVGASGRRSGLEACFFFFEKADYFVGENDQFSGALLNARHAPGMCSVVKSSPTPSLELLRNQICSSINVAHDPFVPLRFRRVGREGIQRLRFSLIALV